MKEFPHDWCEFGEHRVFMLMALARKGENDLTNNNEVVFQEIIKDEDDINRKLKKLRTLAEGYGDYTFRLYMQVNARNTLSTYFAFRNRMNSWIEDKINGDIHSDRKMKKIDNYWVSELMKSENADDQYFIFDLDDVNREESDLLQQDILDMDVRIHHSVETRSGYHIITDPFNYTELESEIEYELLTDGMVYLGCFE